MKAALEILTNHRAAAREAGGHIVGPNPPNDLVVLMAKFLDESFPAYLEIREALERLTGLIRDCHNVYQQEFATYLMRQESFKLAEAALAKARKD